jgi:exonuclease VII large subunit
MTNNYAIDDKNDWLDLESKMSSILSSQQSQSSTEVQLAKHSTTLLNNLADQSTRLHDESQSIQSSLSSRIANEKSALQTESAELHTQLTSVQTLESNIENLQNLNVTLQSQHNEITKNIMEYNKVASQSLNSIDMIEAQHIKSIPKIKHELTLHLTMTNIKWDYGADTNSSSMRDVLKGEVSICNKGVLRNFEIDKEEFSEVEIAEQLWKIIEG